jgi:hypothetical protein
MVSDCKATGAVVEPRAAAMGFFGPWLLHRARGPAVAQQCGVEPCAAAPSYEP